MVAQWGSDVEWRSGVAQWSSDVEWRRRSRRVAPTIAFGDRPTGTESLQHQPVPNPQFCREVLGVCRILLQLRP